MLKTPIVVLALVITALGLLPQLAGHSDTKAPKAQPAFSVPLSVDRRSHVDLPPGSV